MHISRARYVVVCQQFLVTAVVVVVGLSAAGVMTLQIVAPEGHGPLRPPLAPAVRISDAYADSRPVTPKVREVKVDGIDSRAAQAYRASCRRRRSALGTRRHGSRPSRRRRRSTATRRSGSPGSPGRTARGCDQGPGTHPDQRHLVGVDHGALPRRARARRRHRGGGTRPPRHRRRGGRRRRRGPVQAETLTGAAPADLELAVIDPGTGRSPSRHPRSTPRSCRPATRPRRPAPVESPAAALGAALGQPGKPDSALDGDDRVTQPVIYSRAQWGANEKLRDKARCATGR